MSFWKHKPVFRHILHQYSVSSNITHLHFFSSNILYFHQKQLIKGQIFEIFECSGENLRNSLCHFPNHKSVFLQILHDSSVSWKITPLYFFRSKVIYFVRKGLMKVQILEILSAQIKIHQILVIFETTNWFFFKFFINLQYHET